MPQRALEEVRRLQDLLHESQSYNAELRRHARKFLIYAMCWDCITTQKAVNCRECFEVDEPKQ